MSLAGSAVKLSRFSNVALNLSRRTLSTSALCRNLETHTGQKWSEEDIRTQRFQDVNQKEVNTQWAINLIKQVPPKIVDKRVVACDGGPNPALGHPRVFINLDTHEPVACIYCGLRYQLKEHH